MASNYNLRPRPAEVVLRDGAALLARPAETRRGWPPASWRRPGFRPRHERSRGPAAPRAALLGVLALGVAAAALRVAQRRDDPADFLLALGLVALFTRCGR